MELRSHYVATGYIYDKDADAFLLVQHKKLGKWLAPGGHLLEGEKPHTGALREVAEEIGIEGQILDLLESPQVATPVVAQLPAPFCILHEPIPANARDEEHMHIDFVYVIEVNPADTLSLCTAEVERARWFSGEEIAGLDTYENVRQVCRAISILSKQKQLAPANNPA